MFSNVEYGVWPADTQGSPLTQTGPVDVVEAPVFWVNSPIHYYVWMEWEPPDEGFALSRDFDEGEVQEDGLTASLAFDEAVLEPDIVQRGEVISVAGTTEPILDVIADVLESQEFEEVHLVGAAAGLVTIYIQNPPLTHDYITNVQALVEIDEPISSDLSFPEAADEDVPVVTDIIEITNLEALVEYEDEPGLDRVDPEEADTNLPDLTIIPFLLDDAWIDPIPETPSLEEEGDMRFETYDETMVLEHGARISLVSDRTQTYIAGHGLEFELQLWINQTPTDDIWSGTSGDSDQWTNAARPASQWSRVVRTPPDSGIVTVPVPPGPTVTPPVFGILDESGNPILDEGGNIIEEE